MVTGSPERSLRLGPFHTNARKAYKITGSLVNRNHQHKKPSCLLDELNRTAKYIIEKVLRVAILITGSPDGSA